MCLCVCVCVCALLIYTSAPTESIDQLLPHSLPLLPRLVQEVQIEVALSLELLGAVALLHST